MQEQDDLNNFLPCGIFSFKENGTICFINNYLLERLGYEGKELIGEQLEKILTVASKIFYQTHFFPLVKLQKRVEEIYFNLKGRNSLNIPVLVNASYQENEGDGTIHCVCIPVTQRHKYEDEILRAKKVAEDALNKNEELLKIKSELETEREELDKRITQLKQRNTELLELNDVIAHDLQEPARKIGIFADLIFMDEKLGADEQTTNALKVVQKSALKIQLLLVRLQDYMLISTENITITEVHLNKIIHDELQKLKEERPEGDALFSMDELPPIAGNEYQLRLLFGQLLSNCFRFRNKDRKLSITITCSVVQNNQYNSMADKYKYVDYLKITVADNGIGFDPKYANHIFKILRKMDSGAGGLGFGLAFCARIVENHGGTITATGIPGNGATFEITLPLQ